MTKIVNGSSLQPMSGGPPTSIVMLLHGYGSNGADLISLARSWRQLLPGTLFLAPNAPQQCGPGTGYQWWPLSTFTPQSLAAGAASAAPAVDAFIDRKLAQYALTDADLAIVGFSQGTMMALQVGLRRKARAAGVVGYAGMLTGTADLPSPLANGPPVLLIHGSADLVVPVSALHAAEATLQKLGIEVSTHVLPGTGHNEYG